MKIMLCTTPIRLQFFFDEGLRFMRQETRSRYGDPLSRTVKWIKRLRGFND